MIRILGLIPARSGSKGVRGKNLRALCGRPLIEYTIDAALAAPSIARVVVSTEDSAIADVAMRAGADVPFLRPAELARDDTPMFPVIEHAVATLEAINDRYDAICLLQPTCPLRSPEVIENCIGLFQSRGVDTVFTALPVPDHHHPNWVYLVGADGLLRRAVTDPLVSRRQDLPAAMHREGSVYLARRNVIMERKSLYGRTIAGYPMDPAESVNIDQPADWDRAEELLARMRRGG